MVANHRLAPILFFLCLRQSRHVLLFKLLLLPEFPLYLLAQLTVHALLFRIFCLYYIPSKFADQMGLLPLGLHLLMSFSLLSSTQVGGYLRCNILAILIGFLLLFTDFHQFIRPWLISQYILIYLLFNYILILFFLSLLMFFLLLLSLFLFLWLYFDRGLACSHDSLDLVLHFLLNTGQLSQNSPQVDQPLIYFQSFAFSQRQVSEFCQLIELQMDQILSKQQVFTIKE